MRGLDEFSQQHYYSVILMFIVIYVFLQTFAVPGSIFLSLLSGSLFSFPVALFLVCLSSSWGASNCYLLSQGFLTPYVESRFHERLLNLKLKVSKHRDELLYYMIFLRVTPLVPNWLINISSPAVGMPLYPFWLGSFIGVALPSCVFIQLGQTIQTLTNDDVRLTPTHVIGLILAGFMSLLPVLFKRKLMKRFD
eukprot:Colp12_sorted_trinity150504_noHs@30661